MVVLFHVGSGLGQAFELSSNPFKGGASGVDIFFVLSGFIIAYTADPSRGVVHFLKRRIARIVPLYWFLTSGIILVALLMPQLLNSTVVNTQTVWKSYLFIPYLKENGLVQPILFLGWTLCYEMYFYAIFALSLVAGRHASWVSCIAICGVVLAGALWPDGPVLWRFYTEAVILEFVFGILLYQFFLRCPTMRNGSLLLATAFFATGAGLFAADLSLPSVMGHGIPAAFIVAAFLCLPLSQGPAVAALALLGDASYALYLSHPYIIQIPVKLLGEAWGFAATASLTSLFVGLAVLVSLGLHAWIEKPAKSILLRIDDRNSRMKRRL